MRLLVLVALLMGFSWCPVYAHCGKCKADGSEMIKKSRQVR